MLLLSLYINSLLVSCCNGVTFRLSQQQKHAAMREQEYGDNNDDDDSSLLNCLLLFISPRGG